MKRRGHDESHRQAQQPVHSVLETPPVGKSDTAHPPPRQKRLEPRLQHEPPGVDPRRLPRGNKALAKGRQFRFRFRQKPRPVVAQREVEIERHQGQPQDQQHIAGWPPKLKPFFCRGGVRGRHQKGLTKASWICRYPRRALCRPFFEAGPGRWPNLCHCLHLWPRESPQRRT